MARRKKGAGRQEKTKQKRTYKIVAPVEFESKVVGETLASKPDHLLNRIVPVSLAEIQDAKVGPAALYTTVKLRITSYGEDTAHTEFAGHETAFSYLRSLARRRRSVLHDVIDVATKDGKKLRIKTLTVTFRKVSSVMKRNIRHALYDAVVKRAASMNYSALIKDMLLGKFSKEVAKELNKITPISNFVLKKSEVREHKKEARVSEAEASAEEGAAGASEATKPEGVKA